MPPEVIAYIKQLRQQPRFQGSDPSIARAILQEVANRFYGGNAALARQTITSGTASSTGGRAGGGREGQGQVVTQQPTPAPATTPASAPAGMAPGNPMAPYGTPGHIMPDSSVWQGPPPTTGTTGTTGTDGREGANQVITPGPTGLTGGPTGPTGSFHPKPWVLSEVGPQDQGVIDNNVFRENYRNLLSESYGGQGELFNTFAAASPMIQGLNPFVRQNVVPRLSFPSRAAYFLESLDNPGIGNFRDFLGGGGLRGPGGLDFSGFTDRWQKGGLAPDVIEELRSDSGLVTNLLNQIASKRVAPMFRDSARGLVGRELAGFRDERPEANVYDLVEQRGGWNLW